MIFGIFRRDRTAKAWIVAQYAEGPWAKVVVYGTPRMKRRIGPFRSEGDAEEAADHLNAGDCDALFYNKDNTPPSPPIDCDCDDCAGEEWNNA